MIDIKLPIQVPDPVRPAGDVQAVHPVVPYARGGIDPRQERDRKGPSRPPAAPAGHRSDQTSEEAGTDVDADGHVDTWA
ncbi:MAG: hypothetical protein JJU06_18395 [Ectothiorhodospiraceae bacterium]|nr:hypothetical protein [Ectothiorhodospiraceae bacterium]MCH8506193.1 hypothetical protein [Ectothiorhodospiraceae bacterium]